MIEMLLDRTKFEFAQTFEYIRGLKVTISLDFLEVWKICFSSLFNCIVSSTNYLYISTAGLNKMPTFISAIHLIHKFSNLTL